MKRTIIVRQLKLVLVASAIAGSLAASQAQTSDALLNKLVSKGILTQQEADELKKETDAGFDKAYRTRAGLPEWVTSIKFYGDVRGRFDGIYIDNDANGAPNNDRNRMRYRLRVGATATFKDNLEMGFRLTSGEAQGGFGGDPISGNASFQDNGSKKFLWVDLAYGKWTPIKDDTWQLSGMIGKMESPFVFSPLVLDDDYTPEGIGLSSIYNLNKDHALKFGGGFFWLDEISQGSQSDHDPFLLGLQARWDAKWTEAMESSVGLGVLAITDEQSLTNFSVPNLNVGNTRMADGTLREEFTPVVADASFTYLFNAFGGYKTKFPLKVGGLVIHNPGASEDNSGYELGIYAGKAGKKGTWDLSYRWRYTEHDAWYEELADSDFAAFYQAGFPNSGASAGYRAGTNLRGHIFRASYSPADAFNLSISYYLTEAIDGSVVGGRETDSGAGRVLVDAMWKF